MSLFLMVSLGQEALGYGGAPEQSSTNNYTVKIIYDKESYIIGEIITFSGNVNKYDTDRSLRISIFNSNGNLIVTQKTPVNEDRTFSHEVSLNEKFSDGKFQVKAQYGNSKSTVEKISFTINESASTNQTSENTKIPSWIRNNAEWWADGSISDDSFVQGIQFMIKEGLMRVSK
jgi:antitoxin component YwqK of YwqJK toxin-antitoxin module